MSNTRLRVVDGEDREHARMYAARMREEERARRREARVDAVMLAGTAIVVVLVLLMAVHFLGGGPK